MLPSQKAAVDRNMSDLVGSLEWTNPVFLSFLQQRGFIGRSERDLVEVEMMDAEKLQLLLHILSSKDNGWSSLLYFLRSNGNSDLADKLEHDDDESYAEERGYWGVHEREPIERVAARQSRQSRCCSLLLHFFKVNRQSLPSANKLQDCDDVESAEYTWESKRSALEQFSLRLAEYYRVNYTYLPTMGESPINVKDAWVPLHIDGRMEDHFAADPMDHKDLLNRLRSTRGRNVALIKGDPGMGKTTLAKKIAFDWAINYRSMDAQQFSLVLAAPLRGAGKSNLFDQLAIDYFLSVGGGQLGKDIDKAELIREINLLEYELLVILDGLDEYESYDESPFNMIFAAPFQHYSANCHMPPPTTTFKLIITARPYACERVNEEFFPLRFVILPLDANYLRDFVQHYCTPEGVIKVTLYLTANANLVIQVPLLLTFVCFLADSVKEIPTNMTRLYESLVRQMIKREKLRKKLKESVNIRQWKESDLVKTTGQLAYQGGITDEYEFSDESVEKYRVTKDSFICGFLLYKFDFTNECLMAEFPHRSIQEFFAALNCYQLMMSRRKDVLSDVYRLIRTEDNQVGRFLFGICAEEWRFHQMVNWLNPSLTSFGCDLMSATVAISRFGASLVDCTLTETQIIGQILFNSVSKLEENLIISWDHQWSCNTTLQLDNLSDDFRNALHLAVLTRDADGPITDWLLADNMISARLAVVNTELQELLGKGFCQIDTLIWRYSSSKRDNIADHIASIPQVKILILTTACNLPTTVTVSVRYDEGLCSQLDRFGLKYNSEHRDGLLALVADEKSKRLSMDETKVCRK